jgi:hypothetical protein
VTDCDWVMSTTCKHTSRCGQPATAMAHPPESVDDEPVPLCAGHADIARGLGLHVTPDPHRPEGDR